MLICCPDCKNEVSGLAPACPHCGRPLRAQTIEQTGKGWKAAQLLAVLAVVAGIAVLAISATAMTGNWQSLQDVIREVRDSKNAILGCLLVACGFVLGIVARVGAWWHHG